MNCQTLFSGEDGERISKRPPRTKKVMTTNLTFNATCRLRSQFARNIKSCFVFFFAFFGILNMFQNIVCSCF